METNKIANKILVIDDEDCAPIIIERLTRGKEYSMLRAINGKDGVEKYNSNKGDVFYVLSDKDMPVMNGLEATLEIRKIAEKDGKNIPISLMSGKPSEKDKEYKHINTFYKKPFDNIMDVLAGFDKAYKGQEQKEDSIDKVYKK